MTVFIKLLFQKNRFVFSSIITAVFTKDYCFRDLTKYSKCFAKMHRSFGSLYHFINEFRIEQPFYGSKFFKMDLTRSQCKITQSSNRSAKLSETFGMFRNVSEAIILENGQYKIDRKVYDHIGNIALIMRQPAKVFYIKKRIIDVKHIHMNEQDIWTHLNYLESPP